MRDWASTFLDSKFGNVKISRVDYEVSVKCLDIEQRIWSLIYGIKGDIDMVVEAQVKRKENKSNQKKFPSEKSSVAPLGMALIHLYF